ncbi:MAG TPA: HD domain-containing protein [Planctomycetes bacterium]|nr:HD domain-containing protein [Planctomycetota bacterium]
MMNRNSAFRILLADHNCRTRRELARFLVHRNHDVDCASTGYQATRALRKRDYDLILSDINLPQLSFFDLAAHLETEGLETDVVVIANLLDLDRAVSAMHEGAADFLLRPHDLKKVAYTVERIRELKDRRADDARRLQIRREAQMQEETTLALARAAEERDRMNIGHGRRVASYAVEIGRGLCFTEARLERLAFAGKLHDIGKIGIDDAILNKPGRLNDEEYAVMKRHSEIGEYILKPVSAFRDIAPIIRHHHERFDGAGYPDGLAGDEIPLDARILCLCDFFDAITSKRPYREPASLEQALEIIAEEKGAFFDPLVSEVFIKMHHPRRAVVAI